MGDPTKAPLAILRSRLTTYLRSQRGEHQYRVEMHVPLHHGADTHVADIAAAGESALFGPQAITDPVLIVEIFVSRHRAARCATFKLPAYRGNADRSGKSCWVGSDGRYVELASAAASIGSVPEIFPSDGDVIRLTSVGVEIPLAELYDGIVFDERLTG